MAQLHFCVLYADIVKQALESLVQYQNPLEHGGCMNAGDLTTMDGKDNMFVLILQTLLNQDEYAELERLLRMDASRSSLRLPEYRKSTAFAPGMPSLMVSDVAGLLQLVIVRRPANAWT